MASSASSVASSVARIGKGVAPLRAGQGYSFVLRRLHSLSGIVPIGAFLIEHFISNSESANGVQAYNDQVKFLTSLPFVHVLEWVFIFIPLLYHALYGIWIWYRGESNVSEYPWSGNWLYTSQRWTGIVAFAYILYHVIDMRFMGVHLMGGGYNNAFSKVWFDFQNPWVVAIYVIGIVAASWHFSYGVWLFAAKWGLTVGDKARRKFGFVCLGLAIALVGIGLWSVTGFVRTPAAQVPWVEHD
ncbi:MAG: succinate dehydrogenase [Candidatus Korobacteraceae bacterium]